MQPPATAGGSTPTGTAAAGRAVVAVLEPRPLVRSALVDALAGDPGLTVVSSADTSAAALRALGPVDVVVAVDGRWARGLPRMDPEACDVEDRPALAEVVRAAAAGLGTGPRPGSHPGAPDVVDLREPGLTPRESAVLDCFARGLTAAQAADDLGVSLSAVASAKRRVLSKLDVATPVEALQVIAQRRAR